MANPNTVMMRPICIGNQAVETVKTFKLLGVPIREDLKQNSHVDCIIAKAAKRLIGQNVFKRGHSQLYILNAQPIIKPFQRQRSHLQQIEGFPCVVDLSDMASNHNNPSFLIPKSETRSVCYNLRSGSERTVNKLRRTKRADEFFTS